MKKLLLTLGAGLLMSSAVLAASSNESASMMPKKLYVKGNENGVARIVVYFNGVGYYVGTHRLVAGKTASISLNQKVLAKKKGSDPDEPVLAKAPIGADGSVRIFWRPNPHAQLASVQSSSVNQQSTNQGVEVGYLRNQMTSCAPTADRALEKAGAELDCRPQQ